MIFIKKIRKSLIEKRFFKSLFNKLYPYYKGFILVFLFQRNQIKIFSPKKSVIEKNQSTFVAGKKSQTYRSLPLVDPSTFNFQKRD